LEPAEECVTTHLPKRAVPKMDGAQASEDLPSDDPPALWCGVVVVTQAGSRASPCRKGTGDRCAGRGCPRSLLERRPAQILVAVASTPSGEERRSPAVRG